MKKLLAIFVATVLMTAAFAGCGSSPSGSNASSTPAPAESTSAPAESATAEAAAPAGDPVEFSVGYENNPGEPFDQGVNEWKRLLEERSGGTMTMALFPSSQLGSKNDLIDQMLAGDSIITLADGAFYADRGVPDFGIVFGPYLFEDWEQCWKLTESDWWKEQCDKLEQNGGLKILSANWVYGARHTLTTAPVKTVDDIKGMKIRVPNNTIQIKGFEVLGATPTPMPLGEVYTSLQQGAISGLENPLSVLYNGKFHEVSKYLLLDGHVKNFTTLVCGADFFNSLTPEQQALLIETGNEAGLFNNKVVETAEAEVLQKFIDEGVTVTEPNVDEFKAKAEAFYSLPEVTKNWTPGLYETVKAAMK